MKTYKEKKNAIRFVVKNYWEQHICAKTLSWGEIAQFTQWAEMLGKRYGLIKEFKENGIL